MVDLYKFLENIDKKPLPNQKLKNNCGLDYAHFIAEYGSIIYCDENGYLHPNEAGHKIFMELKQYKRSENRSILALCIAAASLIASFIAITLPYWK